MKFSRIILAAAFAATLFSCTKEEIIETNKVNLTFNVTNEPSASKATLNANAVEFLAGDQIGVWDGTSMNCFETTAGGANASFSGTAASAASYILVSPYNDNYSVNGSVVTYSIPDIQVATLGSADPNALVSMAKVTDPSGEAVLFNCVGLVKVVVPDGLTVKEIHIGGGSDSSVGICGSFTFNTNEKKVSYVSANSMRNSITLVPQAGQNVIAPGTYYIAVRPWTYGGFTLAYVNADNQLCKRTTANSVSIERNHIRPVGSLNTADYAAVTGRAVLRYAGDNPQFTGLIKKLAGGTGTATTTDSVIKKIVFRAHKLPYKVGGTEIQNAYGTNSDVKIYAWVDGDTAYVYTEAPIITLYSNSSNLFRDFAALEEVTFNDVNTMSSASFEYMFRNCTKLKSVDFGNADFSNVTNFSYMFYTGTSALEYVDLGETATTAATTMQSMFNNNQNLKYLNLGPNFTLAATHTNMFLDAARQTSIDAAGDNDKKCQLYASQAFYNDVRANETTFNAARFNFHAQ